MDAEDEGNVETTVRILMVAIFVAVAFLLFPIVVPSTCYHHHLSPAGAEAALRTDLRTFRDVIGEFKRDKGRGPHELQELVDEGYLRRIPTDPITKSEESWILEFPNDRTKGLVDVRSGAEGLGRDGTPYSIW